MVAPVPCALTIATSVSKQTNTCARRFAITISSVLYLTSLTGALHKNKKEAKILYHDDMRELETLLGLVLAATILAALARRIGAPYPVFLALGGALLAFLPGAPSFTVPPELALALFIAPVLLDAAYDASPRDLKDNWAPIASLVVFAVGLTTAAVALAARTLLPEMPWAPAIALGAVVAPPNAAAATAVLRPLRPPHRILTVLEGESLLNDASALLIYRLAVGAVAANGFSISTVAPTFMLAVAGSVVAGPALGWLVLGLMDRVQHVPTAIIL